MIKHILKNAGLLLFSVAFVLTGAIVWAQELPDTPAFFFQAEDGIRDKLETGVQTCALPISSPRSRWSRRRCSPCECFLERIVRQGFLDLNGAAALARLHRQFRSQFDRGHHARVLRESFARNVKSSAVIDRGPDKRQTQRDVDRLAKRQTPHRNHCLIVITRDDGVELAARGAQKHGISRKRSLYIDFFEPAARLYRRHNLRRLFHSKQAAFRSVWIERCDCESRALDSPTLKFTIGEIDDLHHAILFYHANRLRQRYMSRQQHDPKIRCDKSHRTLFGAGQMRQEFRVAGETVAAEKQGAFIDRRRGDRVDIPCRTQLHRRFNVFTSGFPCGTRLDTGFDGAADVVEMIDDGLGELFGKVLASTNDVIAGLKIESAGGVRQQLRVADDHWHTDALYFFFSDSLEHHFRTDARRVAHGDADARQNSPGSRTPA